MQFEYVASGTSHLYVTSQYYRDDQPIVDCVNRIFSEMQGVNDHKYSLLFNALTEARNGKIMNQTDLREAMYSMHADSGGLQIVSLGKENTVEMRDQVYREQAKYSDVAMCFDEIPVTLPDGKSARIDPTTRRFDRSLIPSKAKQTALNIKRQIQVFDEVGAGTRPFVILQGNDVASYMEWSDVLFSNLTDYEISRCGGFALGSAALGSGELEDAVRCFVLTQLKLPANVYEHLHILGVGSVRRMVPFCIFMQNDMYPGMNHVSYDSTTHTSAVSMGNYYLKGANTKLGFVINDEVIDALKSINHWKDRWIDVVGEISVHDILNAVIKPSNWKMTNPDNERKRVIIRIAYATGQMQDFTRDMNRISHDKKALIDYTSNDLGKFSYRQLYQVRDQKDFAEWKSRYSYDLKSNSVPKLEKETTITSLFD